MLRFACSLVAAAVVATLLYSSALARTTGPTTARQASNSSCANLRVCFWRQAGFNGDKRSWHSSVAGEDLPLGSHDGSVKNRFGSRRVRIKDVQLNVVRCVDAGENNSSLPPSAEYLHIGTTGSNC